MPRELEPGIARQIEGMGSFHDMSAARVGGGRFLLTAYEDGTVAMQLLRYCERDKGFTDRRDIPIGAEAFEALADALFEPRSEAMIRDEPVSLFTISVARVDDEGPLLCHEVREEIDELGRVALRVEGLGSGRAGLSATVYEPAVAAYVARKVEMLRATQGRDSDGGGSYADMP